MRFSDLQNIRRCRKKKISNSIEIDIKNTISTIINNNLKKDKFRNNISYKFLFTQKLSMYTCRSFSYYIHYIAYKRYHEEEREIYYISWFVR